ncbi:unnamed protein product, partial [Choristocarpus tenellus]
KTWRHAYEKQIQETEKLKGAGGEAVLAAQWRQRYEKLSVEKADAVAKLDMLRPGGGSGTGGMGEQGEVVASLMQRYQDLKEEYKMYRKKAMHAIQASGGGDGDNGSGRDIPNPKLEYLKNLMVKYLETDEGEVREQMERAIATVLQFSESERQALREKRQAQTAAWMANFTGMFGGGAGAGPSGGGGGGQKG